MAIPTLQDVIEEIQEAVGKITGVRVAPDYAPEQVTVWPAIITYPSSGTATTGEFGIAETRHTVICEVHVARKNLQRDLATLIPFIETVITAITDDPWLDNNCEAFDSISYELGPMKYADTDTLGIRFSVNNILMFPYGKK